MERLARLYQLWSWLPHFRAIGETEHLPTVSKALGLSPSALSRALKQLEAAVGRTLFIRDGRTIRLNQDGEVLLRAVRLGLRGIDDAMTSLNRETAPIWLRIHRGGERVARADHRRDRATIRDPLCHQADRQCAATT